MWRVGELVLCVGYRLQCSVLFIPWTLNNIWIDYWTTLISRVTAMLLIFLIHKDQITPHDFWSPLISTPSWLLVPSISTPPPSSESDSVLHHEGVSWCPWHGEVGCTPCIQQQVTSISLFVAYVALFCNLHIRIFLSCDLWFRYQMHKLGVNPRYHQGSLSKDVRYSGS